MQAFPTELDRELEGEEEEEEPEKEMFPCDNAVGKWSAKKMDDGEALRTVESLRGRLIVERAASKAAMADELLMNSKLKELEAQLRRETKARKRFEKKLSCLRKKLQSLNIPYTLNDSEQSLSSSSSLDNSESSHISSVASTEEPEQEQEAKPQIDNKSTATSSQKKENSKSHILPESSVEEQILDRPIKSISSNQNSGSSSDEMDENQQCPPREILRLDERSEKNETDWPRPSSEMEDNEEDTCKKKEENDVDNTMALVPLSFPGQSSENSGRKDAIKISSESVRGVLDNLKQIRGEIQRTMQRRRRQSTRQMIEVG